MKRLFLICAVSAALAACATPTLYQEAARPGAVGYSESRIEPGRYRVTFQGGAGAPAAQVSDYVLLRAAELTVRDGYDWFRVVERGGYVRGGSGSSVSVGTGAASYGRHSAVGLGLGTTFDLSGGPALERSAEILMGRGPTPSEPDAYNARGVIQDIGPRAHPETAP